MMVTTILQKGARTEAMSQERVSPRQKGRLLRPGLLALVAACLLVAACDPAEPAAESPEVPDRSLAIEGVSIVATDREEIVPDRTVLVADGLIRRIGARGEVDLPPDALRIDGSGRYLVPGMAEMHGHLPTSGPSDPAVQDLLFLYVANGVTLVRGMQGHPAQIEVREAVEQGEIVAPRLILGSPAMGWGGTPEEAEAEDRVREFSALGFDLIKIGEGPDPATYQALIRAAEAEGLPVAGHVPDEVGLLGVLEAGQVTIDHLDNYVEELVPEEAREGIAPLWGVAEVAHLAEEGRISGLVEATVASGTAQVPTMALWEVFFGDRPGADLRRAQPEVRYMPSETVDGWEEALAARHQAIGSPDRAGRVVELRRLVFQRLHQGGAVFLLGTDSPQLFSVPGFANHREMALWVELGMTPFEVLSAGTWNVAEHLGELDVAGSVEEGKRADLILLEANPLEDIGHMAARAGVVMDGRWLPEEEIQARLAEIAGRAQGG
jgi:hypothetical protein